MIFIQDISRDLDDFRQEFSIEHILVSIKKLETRIKQLEARNVYELSQPGPI